MRHFLKKIIPIGYNYNKSVTKRIKIYDENHCKKNNGRKIFFKNQNMKIDRKLLLIDWKREHDICTWMHDNIWINNLKLALKFKWKIYRL